MNRGVEPSAANHQVFHRLPFLQRLASHKAELEPASATAGTLIKTPVNPDIGQGAEQQRADTTVTDEQNIAILRAFKTRIDFSQNALLCNVGFLPTTHAPGRFCKELVGNSLKFLGR